MYDIHHRRFFDSEKDRTVIAERIGTLEEARNQRVVSGDLVVHSGTNSVVIDESWLWPWEIEKKDCYARKAINHEKGKIADHVMYDLEE